MFSARSLQSFAVLFTLVLSARAWAQSAPASQPADGERTPIMTTVIELVGDVKHSAGPDQEWVPCALGDQYPEGTRLLAGIRSSIKLQIGDEEPYTCMLIDSVGLTELTETAIAGDAKRVRVGVGYGRIRAGVAEGGLQSDFTVDSPVATLSKRGTWGFSLAYERGTDYFEIGLTDRGLVEAIKHATNQRRLVNPRELVTTAMRRWLDEAAIQRNVSVVDALGQSGVEIAYNRLRQDGLGVVGLGDGRAFIDLTSPGARDSFAGLAQQALNTPGLTNFNPGINNRRPEGSFGTGRGDELISVLIDASSDLAKKGAAQPGRYPIRRQALEGWLRQHRRP